MKKLVFIFLLIFTLQSSAQEIEIVQFGELQEKMLYTEAPLTVFNFWATWCAPCIKELPHFDQLETDRDDIKSIPCERRLSK